MNLMFCDLKNRWHFEHNTQNTRTMGLIRIGFGYTQTDTGTLLMLTDIKHLWEGGQIIFFFSFFVITCCWYGNMYIRKNMIWYTGWA
jgi:hypothetical protein